MGRDRDVSGRATATGAFFASVVTAALVGELMPDEVAGDTFPWWVVYPDHVVFLLGIMLAFQMDKAHYAQGPFVLLLARAVA